MSLPGSAPKYEYSISYQPKAGDFKKRLKKDYFILNSNRPRKTQERTIKKTQCKQKLISCIIEVNSNITNSKSLQIEKKQLLEPAFFELKSKINIAGPARIFLFKIILKN